MKKFNMRYKINNLILYLTCNNPISKKYRLSKLDSYLQPISFENILDAVDDYQVNSTRMLTDTKDTVLKEEIDDFLEILKKNFREEDLHNFYYNVEWIKSSRKKFSISDLFKNATTYGTYIPKKNKFNFYKVNDKLYTSHELFHMSSRDTTRVDYSTGFALDVNSGMIGYSLNEGYTQLLAIRYNEMSIEDNECYYLETKIASDLEMIVGKDKMQSLYLNADFFGLVEELEKYYTREEIIKFMINFDLINLYNEKEYFCDEEMDKIDLLMEDLVCFLTKGYSKILLTQNNSIETNKALLTTYLQDINLYYDSCSDYEFNIDKINQVIIDILGIETKLDECILKKEETCYNK